MLKGFPYKIYAFYITNIHIISVYNMPTILNQSVLISGKKHTSVKISCDCSIQWSITAHNKKNHLKNKSSEQAWASWHSLSTHS